MKDKVWWRVNEIYKDSLYYHVNLQAVSAPYNGRKIIVSEGSALIDREYDFVKEFVEEIDSHQYSEIEPGEVFRPTGNLFYDDKVNYVYYFETRTWFVVKHEALFLWSKDEDQWGVRIGDNGYASSSEIDDLDYLNEKIIEKSEELRRKGDPRYWTESFDRVEYSIPLSLSGELYFKYLNSAWLASKNQREWIPVSSIIRGDVGRIGFLSDTDLVVVSNMDGKGFLEGLGVLSSRTITGHLDSL